VRMNVVKYIIVKAQGCRKSLGWSGVESDENPKKPKGKVCSLFLYAN
jgi:hypothetical protein